MISLGVPLNVIELGMTLFLFYKGKKTKDPFSEVISLVFNQENLNEFT